MGLLDITNQINVELEGGSSRNEVFEKYVSSNPAKAATYAYCIASIPTSVLRKQYMRPNALLALLLVAYAVLVVLSELPIDVQEPTIFILIRTLFPLVFAYFTFRFHGGVYRLMTIWFLYDLLETILITGVPTPVASLKLLVLFFVTALSFFIARRVFPNLRILGPKRDPSGKFYL